MYKLMQLLQHVMMLLILTWHTGDVAIVTGPTTVAGMDVATFAATTGNTNPIPPWCWLLHFNIVLLLQQHHSELIGGWDTTANDVPADWVRYIYRWY